MPPFVETRPALGVTLVVASMVACGGGSSRPGFPYVVNAGGPFLANPTVIPILWQPDENAAAIQRYLAYLAASNRYGEALGQYGIRSLVVAPGELRTEAAPAEITDDAIRTIIKQDVAASEADGGLPSALADILYVVLVPQTTVETFVSGEATLCIDAGGYHSFVLLADGTQVAYAVVGACAVAGSSVSALDFATIAMGHEIAEGVTDPFLLDIDFMDGAPSSPAWSTTSDPSWPLLLGGGEVGDLCAYTEFRDDAGFLEQFYWSNALADAGHHPCSGPLLLAAPPESALQALTGVMDVEGNPLPDARGLLIGTGQTANVTLDLTSDTAPDAVWPVKVLDSSALFGGPPGLTFVLSAPNGSAGTELSLSVRVEDSPSHVDGNAGLGGFLVATSFLDGGARLLWPVLVQSTEPR